MRSGRRKKVAQRAAPTKFDPCPPGAIGGQYKPLSETEVPTGLRHSRAIAVRVGYGRSSRAPDTGFVE